MQPPKPTLRVHGRGRTATPPDVVELSLAITAEDRDYGKTIKALNMRLDGLRRSIAEAGEDTEALKTTSFTVSIENEVVEGRYVFRGFCGDHRLELRLPIDQSRLARVFSAISTSGAKPELSIVFTVSDPEAIRLRVLEDAVKNAQRRAEVIAAASRQKLGTIIAIDYGYSKIRVSSKEYDLSRAASETPAIQAPEIQPSEIESTDTVQIAWEITHDTATEA